MALPSSVLLILATTIALLLGRASAAVRHRLWCLTFAGLLLLYALALLERDGVFVLAGHVTAAAAIGMTEAEVDLFLARLDATVGEFKRQQRGKVSGVAGSRYAA